MDYDCDSLVSSRVNVRNTSTVYRDNDLIKATREQVDEDKEILFKIRSNIIENKDIRFEYINNPAKLDENNVINKNSSWFLIKPSKITSKMNKYKLNTGDIVKIGRISLRIRDIHFSSNNKGNNINKKDIISNSENGDFNTKEVNTLKTEANANGTSRNYVSKKVNYISQSRYKAIKHISLTKNLISKIEKKNKVCRICYIEEDDPENNPLLQPCLCSGSMKYIHLSCLKHWISTRSCEKIDTTTYCIVYIIKPVECELCKQKFPDLIKHNDKMHHLLDFSNDFESYLTLESLTLDKYKNKFIYTISLMNSNKKMKLGRGHDCDILLSDISVSRIHCYLLADGNNKNLFIIDNDSKFGTLILVQSPFIKIEELLPLNIQIGRTYVQCIVKKPFKFFDCCNTEEFSNIFYYFEQNEKKVNEHINLIVKSDDGYDLNGSQLEKENNTCEQKYPKKINGEYTYEKFATIDINKDKISDNEYFRMRHKAENKNKNFGDILIDDNNQEIENIEKEQNSINMDKENNNENNVESIKIGDDNENNNENENENNNEDDNDKEEESQEVNENDATIQ